MRPITWLSRGSFHRLQPAGSLVAKTRSLDQARAVVTFLDAASEKTLRSAKSSFDKQHVSQHLAESREC